MKMPNNEQTTEEMLRSRIESFAWEILQSTQPADMDQAIDRMSQHILLLVLGNTQNNVLPSMN